jgi:hypothetical protein
MLRREGEVFLLGTAIVAPVPIFLFRIGESQGNGINGRRPLASRPDALA